MVRVLIIIVTYNGEKFIRKCLSSIDRVKYDVLVIDNKSSDDTIRIIKSEFPDVMLSIQSQNSGFGQANNIGLKKVIREGYDYALLLNQDAWVLENTIDDLIKAQQEHPAFWVLSPLQMHSSEGGIEKQFASYLKNAHIDPSSKQVEPIAFVNAAIWLMTIDCIKKVGGFDPLFPHYGEDNDYVNRVVCWGGKVGVEPSVIAYHDKDLGNKAISIDKNIYRTTLAYIGSVKNPNHSIAYGYFKCVQLCLRKTVKALLTMDMTLMHINGAAMRNVFKLTHQIMEHRKLSFEERAFLNKI
ncbi:glycosyltransferase family 2 protein [Bacteroides sp.]|uniref:glycosyltransferase family 2 protein n=1 Tax=Bacteroides sp. TaxID=29523 RepID=UPI00261D6D57|nr:glycosyltransferase family 2 protein [Bacteroides sp.]MDD3038756.1 glycosyltransferase family 2 protein [Bacteroides sp.]